MTPRAIAGRACLGLVLGLALSLMGCESSGAKRSEKADAPAAKSAAPKAASAEREIASAEPASAKVPAVAPPDPAAAAIPAPVAASAWSREFVPPAALDTDRIHLEPLGPQHAKLDHAAFMSSRDHLHKTLHWGSWPREDATVEQNERDLARHRSEFDERSAYAFTVLRPDGSECVGCVYLNPVDGVPSAVEMSWWVTEPEVASGLDRHLFVTVVEWLDRDWPYESVLVQLHVENDRGAQIASSHGFEPVEATRPDHVALMLKLDGSQPE